MLAINILQHLQKTAASSSNSSEETSRFQMAYSKLQENVKSVNQELHATIALLNHIVKQSPDGVVFVTLEGKLLFCNETACKLLKKNPDGLPLQRFWDVFDDDAFGFSMREALRLGISHKHSYIHDLEISTFFLYGCPTASRGILLIIKDLSEIKKWQLIANRNDRMKELGEGVAIAAHEMRNAIGGIRGFSMLLERDLQGQSHLAEMACLILDGVRSLERMVHSLLHYSKHVDVQLVSVDMCAFLRKMGKWIKSDPLFPQNIKLALHIPFLPVMVPIDEVALRSALLNLVHNAFHAMPEGGTLTLSLLQMTSSCEISVNDTGVGMDEEQMSRLFSPFYTTKKQGNGVGLVEVKKNIQAHAGKIDVRSQKDRGSTFILTLPLQRYQ